MLTAFRGRNSIKTVSYEKQMISEDKYASWFSHQMEAYVFSIPAKYLSTLMKSLAFFGLRYFLFCVLWEQRNEHTNNWKNETEKEQWCHRSLFRFFCLTKCHFTIQSLVWKVIQATLETEIFVFVFFFLLLFFFPLSFLSLLSEKFTRVPLFLLFYRLDEKGQRRTIIRYLSWII